MKRGLRERIIRYVISGEKGKELEGEELDEVVLEGITQSQAHVIQDESTIGSRKVAFSAFVKVVSSLPQQSKIDQLIGNPQCIVESMKKMHLGKREKGNKEGACKFQTLNGRYFLKKNHIYGADMTSVEGSIFIKRGSIVSLDNCKHKKFMITVVWKANGSNKNSKYFPSRDTPLWEKQKTSQKFQKYRLGAREVNIDGNHITYKKYDVDEGVKDGVNVRDIYRRVDLSQITEVYGSIK